MLTRKGLAGRMAVAVLWLWIGAASAHEFDEPLRIFTADKLFADVEQVAVGDVNGDGLDDIVTLHRTQPSFYDPINGRIAITLQRRGGSFEFPRFHACQCVPDQLKLVNFDSDPALEIIYKSSVNDHPVSRFGFQLLKLLADGTMQVIPRYSEGWLRQDDAFSLVDINQDGYDDLFFTYLQDDSSVPGIDYRYVIWYHTLVRGRPDLRRYHSDPFYYSGVTDPLRSGSYEYSGTPPVRQRVDLDGDGYFDAIEGKCPTQCLFRQQPYRQMSMQPITTDATGRIVGSTLDSYGDLDGDGRPDRLSVETTGGIRIELQTDQNRFSQIGQWGELFMPGAAQIADLDNNGLNDFVILSASMDYAGQGWLDTFLQTSAGEFTVNSKQVASQSEYPQLLIADMNADGCRDLLALMRRQGELEASLSYFRGRDCVSAPDLRVDATFSRGRAQARVTHAAGTVSSAERVLRVTIAPAMREDATLALSIRPAAGCTAVTADLPRRMFDCLVPALTPGQTRTFTFEASTAPGRSVELQTTAFLLDDAADTNPHNNRRQIRAVHLQPAAPAPRGQ